VHHRRAGQDAVEVEEERPHAVREAQHDERI
jgi:hypothetical protein